MGEFDFSSLYYGGAILGHISYLLIIAAMLMSHLFYLRVLAVASGLTSLFYSLFWVYDPISVAWEALFVSVILFQITITAYHNRMSRFDAEQTRFRDLVVPGLAPSDVRLLMKIAKVEESPAGTVFTREGESVEKLIFVLSGEIDVLSHNVSVARCGPGDFVGEVSVTGGGDATATAIALAPTRHFSFSRDDFQKLVAKNEEIKQELELAFRKGLREKLIRTNELLAATPPRPGGAKIEFVP